jgi:hypothetical protein
VAAMGEMVLREAEWGVVGKVKAATE